MGFENQFDLKWWQIILFVQIMRDFRGYRGMAMMVNYVQIYFAHVLVKPRHCPDGFAQTQNNIIYLKAFYEHGLSSIATLKNDSTHYKVWGEITYPFPNLNGAAVEVWEWVSSPHSLLGVWLLDILRCKLIHASKRGKRIKSACNLSKQSCMWQR